MAEAWYEEKHYNQIRIDFFLDVHKKLLRERELEGEKIA